MVKINLLPWRAELREKRKKEFQTRSVLAGLLGAVTVFAGYMYFNNQLSEQEQVNQMIVAENAQLDTKLKDLEGLDIRRAQILERMKLIDGLQGQRPVIVRLADELVRITPRDLFFTEFERKGDKFTLKGKAQDPNVVADLLRGLENSPWFRNAFMNSFVAADEKVVNAITNVVNKVATEAAKSNPTVAQQLTSLVQRPEMSYGQFVVTVDLDDVSKLAPVVSDTGVVAQQGTMPNANESANQPANPPVGQAVAQPQPATPAINPQPATQPAQPGPEQQQSAQPASQPANGQANPSTPNNQEAKQ